jgi:GntR family transcriptional repressor for pyruvate dehydrogenase complex
MSSNPFELKVVDKTKVYDSIVEQILTGIRSGAFPPGTVLPPERELAAQVGVSRGSVREAIRVLEYAGVLDVRTGSGTYVTEAGASKAFALRAHAAVAGEQSPLDVIIARRALEPISAQYAALNRHPRDLIALKDSITKQARLVKLGEDPSEPDLYFHIALAEASRNPVLRMLFERVAEIMRQETWVELKHRSRDRPGKQELYLTEHRAIFSKIQQQDAGAAAAAMQQHLDSVEEGLMAEVEE